MVKEKYTGKPQRTGTKPQPKPRKQQQQRQQSTQIDINNIEDCNA